MSNTKNAEAVRVAIRCRPLSSQEIQDQRASIVTANYNRSEVSITNPKSSDDPKTFSYDHVFSTDISQKAIYLDTAFPIVDSVLQGYNGTIFAYGQTGTGKTYTMEGKVNSEETKGIIPRAFEQIFNFIESTPDKQFLVRVSFLEIYNEEVRDLLARDPKNKLKVREKPGSGFYAEGLLSVPVENVADISQKLLIGSQNREVRSTGMNDDSSRSHSIFSITVECCETGPDGKAHIKMGKLNLVDLAGSEAQDKTKATGQGFKEAVNINKSLVMLGNVISALINPKSLHIPYRDSRLTMLLQDSLGGNTKTVMIANIGPADWNYEETMNTLRYASRAKFIKNKPKINEDPKDAKLREYQEEIEKLKAQLNGFQGEKFADGGPQIVKEGDEQKIKEIEERLQKEKEELLENAEKERKKIEAQINLVDAEKEKLLQDLAKREEAQKKDQEKQEKLLKKLKRIEKQVLKSSEDAAEHAQKQQEELEKLRKELEEKRLAQEKLAKDLAVKEAESLLQSKTTTSEIADKDKKLFRLFNELQRVKVEMQELHEDFNRERESYQEQIFDMNSQLKLKDLVINYFIPQDVVAKIEARSVWDEQGEDWILPNIQLTQNSLTKPGSSLGFTRPMSGYARKNMFSSTSSRFRSENILDLDLDLPSNTLERFDGSVSSNMKRVINSAISQDEDELEYLGELNRPNVYYYYTDEGISREYGGGEERKRKVISAPKRGDSAHKRRVPSGHKEEEKVITPPTPKEEFPRARGLVGSAKAKNKYY